MLNLKDLSIKSLRNFNFKNLSFKDLPREAWPAIIIIFVMIYGLGTWGVHSLLDYPWWQCLLLAPVFLAAMLAFLALALYMA